MSLVLEGIDIAGDSLEDHQPENIEYFELWLTITVGISNGSESSLFNLCVCTPEKIRRKIKYGSESDTGAMWGRHLLIVDEFNPEKIRVEIKKMLTEISEQYSDSGEDLVEKFSRYAHWEFEDYVP